MRMRIVEPARHEQRGQTIVLVAISMVFVIAMAALAIDLTTLYVARGEMQRAADGAALAGAKAFVDSGTTTAPDVAGKAATDNMQKLAADLANTYVSAILTRNEVGGVAPSLVPAGALATSCGGNQSCLDFTTHPGNPQITVTLQRRNVPTFFARIFGRTLATVTATATAEAYNSSNATGAAGAASMPPVAPTCVKPWIVPNADPRHAPDKFVAANGQIVHPGVWGGNPDGIIGEQITLINDCKAGVACSPLRNPPVAGGDPGHLADGLDYLPAQVAAAAGPCPSCGAGGTNYEQGSACCDGSNTYSCGTSVPSVFVDVSTNTVNPTISSVECLIGATGSGLNQGQDSIDTGFFLAQNGRDPIEITAGSSSPHNGSFVNTSRSIVTLPIYDSSAVPIPGAGPLGPVKIIGYMQGFVGEVRTPDADVVFTVLNVSGCGTNVDTSGTLPAVSGGGVSTVPVRLIHN